MPSRPICWAIIAFWMLTVGWFIKREVWWQVAIDAPPRFVIELADEAVRQSTPVPWALYRNGQRLVSAKTTTNYLPADDSFELICVIFKFDALRDAGLLTINSYRSTYHVSRSGEMIGQQSEIDVTVSGSPIKLLVRAETRGIEALPFVSLDSPFGHFEPSLQPIPLTGAGVLTPLHPVNKLRGLRIGQRWRQPEFDPLADAQRAAVEGLARSVLGPVVPKLTAGAPRTLIAEVNGPRSLVYRNADQSCFVIEYRGDESRASTWVRMSDGLVLRQEASFAGDELALQRE